MSRRKICVVTGSRAEYGILRWVLQDIHDAPDLQLQLVVTGMHLSPEFGLTYREIEADGFEIAERVEMLLSSDTAVGIGKSIGLGTIGMADAFARLRPDLVVIPGDRFEILAAAQAAMVAGIPIAHLHGGEVSEGAFDESIRHAITKMASLHFVAAERFRQRVIQLGELPERVFTVGAPGLDGLQRAAPLARADLDASLGRDTGRPFFLVTYHPATRGEKAEEAMGELLAALDRFPQHDVIITYPNADTAGRRLIGMIEDYARSRTERVGAFASLGQRRYQALLALAAAVVGNSSSGLVEAPSFRVPTVNIGTREQGRLRACSVIDCGELEGAIAEAITRALSEEFRQALADMANPYGDGHSAPRIVETLRSVNLQGLEVKPFYDLPSSVGEGA